MGFRGVGGDRHQGGRFGGALVHGEAAAGAEGAALGEVDQVGGLAFDGDEFGGVAGFVHQALVEAGYGVEEADGVGMAGVGVDFQGGAAFDDFAGVHYIDAVGVAGDDAEVVGDDDEGDAEVLGEGFHQFQDLGLDGDIEGGGGFVGDDEAGVATEGHSDHHALAHTAAELVGVLPDAAFRVGDADLGEEVDGVFAGFVAGFAHMELDGFGELAVEGEDGVEGGHGFLEDHGHFGAPDAAHIVHIDFEDVLAVEEDFAGDGASGWVGDEAHQGEGADAFAAAAFAHEAEGFAGEDFVGDVVHGFDDAFVGEEVGLEVFDFKQGLGVHGLGSLLILGGLVRRRRAAGGSG